MGYASEYEKWTADLEDGGPHWVGQLTSPIGQCGLGNTGRRESSHMQNYRGTVADVINRQCPACKKKMRRGAFPRGPKCEYRYFYYIFELVRMCRVVSLLLFKDNLTKST
jgi:hypothetical protein